jgi:uncharacterized cupredoxin-like copper-binding protein
VIARLAVFALCSMLGVTSGAAFAAAPAQSVNIALQDSSTAPSIAHMRMVLDHATVKRGRVTFHAENQSKNLVHEVVIARNDGAKPLPMDAKHSRVFENRVRRLGEIADLSPGTSRTLALDLKPGTYVMFCNQPGHYQDGMSAKLTVVQ